MLEMQKFLITTDEVLLLARGMSVHLEEDKIETYLREAENIDVRAALGDELLLDIKEHPDNYDLLLNGGTYQTKCGSTRLLIGLKSALAYYTYARIVKCGDLNVTRFGSVLNDSEESSRPSFKEKMQAYNDAFSIAANYMQECVDYLRETNHPLHSKKNTIRVNGTNYKVIGE